MTVDRAVRRLIPLLSAELDRPVRPDEMLARGRALSVPDASAVVRVLMVDHPEATRRCLRRLTEQQRACIDLRVMRFRGVAEAAADLGVPPEDFKAGYSRALRRMVEWLPAELGWFALSGNRDTAQNRPISPEEARFRRWYRERESAAGIGVQSPAQYARMHHLDERQIHRWLVGIGVDPAVHADDIDVPVPHPDDATDLYSWVYAVRRYLCLPPDDMEDLLDGPVGVWTDIERGVRQPDTGQVRALLRRLPDTRGSAAAIGRLHPDVLGSPEAHTHIGDYLRHLRVSAGWSRQRLALMTDAKVEVVTDYETNRHRPPRVFVEACLRFLPHGDVTYAQVVKAFPHLPGAEYLFPSPHATRSMYEYAKYFQRVNNLRWGELVRLFGRARIPASKEWNPSELDALATYDRFLHRASPWNDIAVAWGYSYRMNPAGETVPEPGEFDSAYEWVRSLRLYNRKTRDGFDAEMGLTGYVTSVEVQHHRPRLDNLRRMRDAGFISEETLQVAVERFYSHPEARSASPEEAELFWRFIDSRVGSDREQELIRQISEQYFWIARSVASRWARSTDHRNDLAQELFLVVRRAIATHAPATAFATHAYKSCYWAAYDLYLERRFPNHPRELRVFFGKIENYIYRRYGETTRRPSDAEIAAGLGVSSAEVAAARRQMALLTTDELPPDPARPFTEDVELAAAIQGALADLPDPAVAVELAELCFNQELGVEEAATRLGIGLDDARQLLDEAGARLRAAFTELGKAPDGAADPGREGVLRGIDEDSEVREFLASQVKVRQMSDYYGRVIGVLFPTQGGHFNETLRWARKRHRSGDVEIRPARNIGTTEEPNWSYGPPVPVPWSEPIYVDVHANANDFAVDVELDDESGERARTTVRVDGKTFGRLLVATQEFQRAHRRAAPERDIVLLACFAATPGGTAAEWTAGYLHEHDVLRTVHAFPGQARLLADTTSERSELGAEITMDADGRRLPLSRVFPPPSDAPVSG
ncbi:helix-turn-helix domain-containing protein [Nocardia wallacei]|uniref:helix-turn-helix domain-containing protein n=1 Tax=Nocardia wallacei TaxID=480035 RepID=UPI0024584AA9|nr:helix-turn-helix domain-containing protein [Nocardia wallacei]